MLRAVDISIYAIDAGSYVFCHMPPRYAMISLICAVAALMPPFSRATIAITPLFIMRYAMRC